MDRIPPDSLDSLEGVPPSREGELTALIVRVLRAGVGLAAACVAAGLVVLELLGQAGPADYGHFRPRTRPIARGLLGVFLRDLHRHAPRDLVNLGLILLVLTPVTRVAFSLVIYLYENDRLYAAFTLFVLAVLLYSLLGG